MGEKGEFDVKLVPKELEFFLVELEMKVPSF